ncbi:porin [Cupriavidus basilensis]
MTLHSAVDAGIEYNNKSSTNALGTNGNNLWAMQSGNQSGSRWGLRGVEDLGGGLKGIFVLESGFNVDTGTSAQGGRLFGRNALCWSREPVRRADPGPPGLQTSPV